MVSLRNLLSFGRVSDAESDTLLEFKRAIDATSRCRNPVYPRGILK